MPPTFEWLTYMEWSKKYNSDVLHLNVAGTSIVILSSAEAANELLEKRATNYSDRADLPMVNELMGWKFALAFMKHDDHWRAHRRMFHEVFNQVAAKQFHPKERAACNEFLYDVLCRPDHDLLDHLRHMAAKIIMDIAYGITIKPTNDPYVSLANEAVDGLVYALIPGRFLVDNIPLLKYVPAWVPGAGFQRQAAYWGALAKDMLEKPFAEAVSIINGGKPTHSFIRDGLQIASKDPERKEYLETVVKNTAGAMYTAGTGTTVSALGTLVLAMLSNPEALKKAQEEIDRVVGPDRLPDWDDEPNLPYVVACIKESMRWHNVTPIAIPHYLNVEDEYKGYRLPANSIILPNTWAILHDENVYPDPYSFKPERYLLPNGQLNPDGPAGPEAVFGFGRRICPGRHMGLSSVFITGSSLLATFDISKAVDANGSIIEPKYDFFAGLIVTPLSFKCSLKPRSEKAVALIKASVNKD
uniref:Cytochrome P450 n=1 Tax=Mycena chlorophos TaxID=658473 RepID=A0ABQ0LRE5_MYCCL|nr:predicted protein [Mycena chlorophos]